MTTSQSPVVVTVEAWDYGFEMPSIDLQARVQSTLWTDGVVLASCFGPTETGEHSVGGFRGTVTKVPARSYQSPSATRWVLAREDGSEITRERTRAAAVQVAGNLAIGDWAQPIRRRVAAAEREARILRNAPRS